MKNIKLPHNIPAFSARRLVAQVTLLTFIFQNIVLAAGPQVPAAGSGTTTYTAPNGVPVVNIAAPNASGLSHNLYDSFNVPSNGTVLNNATDVRQSQLAGTIRENPNLNGKSASIILNDVTSTQRSVLEGYLEVNGPGAEVIVANPNGITCSGCGFINTPRASLTTGSPNLDGSGNLLGFTVRQGEILINGKGLDASDPNYFDLLARTINIQGQINAKDLQITAGANQFDHATRSVTGPASPSGDQPLYAIDSSALGGMYADRLRLLATENGVGVRLLGNAAATAGDLNIDAAGKIELKNKTYAANDLKVTGQGIESGGDAKNYLYAEHNAQLDAGNNQLTQADGLLYAGNKLDLKAGSIGMNAKDGTIYAGTDFNANATQAINLGSGTVLSDGNLTLTAPSITVGGESSVLYAKSDLSLSADNDLNLGNGQIIASNNLLLHGATVKDISGDKDIRSAGNNLSLTTAGDIVLDNGQVYDAGRDMSLTGKKIQIGGKTATTLTGAYQAGGGIYLNALDAITLASNGSIQSSGDVALNAPGKIQLDQGSKLLAINNFWAQQYKDFDIFGSLIAGGDIYLRPETSVGMTRTRVHDSGSVQGYGLFSLLGSSADPKSNVELLIDAGDQSQSKGQLIADSFDIQADKIEIGSVDASHYGLLQGGEHGGSITTNTLKLDGKFAKFIGNTNIGDAATTSLTVNNDLVNPGLIFAYGNLILNVLGNVDNQTDAAISSGFGDLHINMLGAGKRFDNRANATLYAYNNLSVLYPYGGTFFNHATGANLGEYGIVQSSGSTRLGSTCDPTAKGSGPACKNGSTPAMSITNQGRIESDGDISIVAQTFKNNVPYTSTWSAPFWSGGQISWGDSGAFGGNHGSTNWPYPFGGNAGPTAYFDVGSNGMMYFDFQRIFKSVQQNTLAPYRPRISAGSQGGTLSISTWDGDNSGGTLEGYNVFINSFEANDATSHFLNAAITHDEIKYYQQIGRYKWQCQYDSGLSDVACAGVKDFTHPEFLGEEFPNGSGLTFDSQFALGVDLGATISAVNFVSSIGNLTNSGSPQKPVIDPIRSTPSGKTDLGTLNGPVTPSLPSGPNGQFVLNTSPKAKYLVESNPLYASADNPFLGSDYLAELLGLNPDKLLLRLGDANYENRLIKDQIQQQAGLSLLRSAGNEYDQQKMLMDNASLEAKEQKLSFGVALTSDQVAALKHDMVWMVEKEVQGHKVLVPVVYLTDATRAQSAGDATILAQNAIVTGETFTNRGGTVSGSDKLVVVTRKDIVNSSGTLMGGNVALKSTEGDIINRTEVNRMGGGDNYADVAGKTGGIYATGDMYMDAAHDVKIEGANTYAGGNSNIRAGNNVDIKSLVLESSSHSTSSQHLGGGDTTTEITRVNQRAQTASVGSGGDLTISAKNDVNVKGAVVASENGDTTLLAKEGNVNVSTLELKNSESTKTDKQGFFSEEQVDAKNTSAGAFAGYEKSTSKTDTSSTQNVGSYIGGKGVNIVAKKGDVNVQGSNVEAGENGAYVEAGHDVNITAAYDTYSSTSSYEGHKIGTSADANADGAFSGLRYQREAGNSTQDDRYAVTSGIKSGGDIIVKAGNKLTNEGTDYDAKNDIYVSAKEVENKAAYSTSNYSGHSESDVYGVYGGATTNGMGQSIANLANHKAGPLVVASPEAQAKIGGESNRSDQSESSSTAKVTQFKSGGNVVFDVEGKMVDEGSQYDAGKSIQIVADSYENKAAANTKSSSSESTTSGGQITAGVNAATEVTATASAYGGHSKDASSSSQAVVGGFNAGNNVVIKTKGDTTLEGTNIKAGKNVGIDAGGDLNFKQANNTSSTSSSSEQASANLSASACADLTCASGGAGADGRTAHSKEDISQGVAGSIQAGGNIGLRSGGDMTLQGTNLTSGKDTVLDAGKNFDYRALTSTQTRSGQADGGGGQLGVGVGDTNQALKSGSVNVSGSFERGRDNLDATTRSGGNVQAGGSFVLKSGGDAHMEGTQVAASDAAVDVKGNFKMESAQSTVEQDSYSTKGTVGVGGSKGGGAMGAAGAGGSGGSGSGGGNSLGGSADVDVDVHKKDNLTNQNANIQTTGGTTLNVGGDATLAGARIDAQGGVSGEVKGNLNIESRTDRIKEEDTSVKTFVGINSVSSSTSTKGMSGADKADHVQGKALETAGNIGGSGVDIAVDSHKKDEVSIGEKSGISGGAGGLGGLKVGGDVTMKGASEEILGADIKGNVSKSDIETHKHDSDVSFRAPGSLAGLTGQDPGKTAEVNGTLFKTPGSGGGRHQNDHEADLPVSRPRGNGETAELPSRPHTNDGPEHGGLTVQHPQADNQATIARHQPELPEANRPRAQSEPPTVANRTVEPDARPQSPTSGFYRLDDPNQPVHQPAAPELRPRSNSEPALATNRHDGPDSRPQQENSGFYGWTDPNQPAHQPGSNEARPRGNSEPPLVANRHSEPEQHPNVDGGGFYGWDDGQGGIVPANGRPRSNSEPLPVANRDGLPSHQADPSSHRNATGDDEIPLIPRRRANADEPQPSAQSRSEDGGQNGMANARQHAEQNPDQQQPPETEPKQQVFTSEKGFKMKTLDSDFKGENEDKGKFWNEFKAKNNRTDTIKVQYLTPEQRAAKEVVVKDGMLVYKQSGRKVDTSDKRDGAIFVMDGEGRLYASTEAQPGKFHHSSFLGGEPIAMAGHMVVKDGKLVHLDNQSGHYKPDNDQLQTMRSHLTDQGLDLNGVPNIHVMGKTENGHFSVEWRNSDTGETIYGNPRRDAADRLIWEQQQPRQPANEAPQQHEEPIVRSYGDVGNSSASRSNQGQHGGQQPDRRAIVIERDGASGYEITGRGPRVTDELQPANGDGNQSAPVTRPRSRDEHAPPPVERGNQSGYVGVKEKPSETSGADGQSRHPESPAEQYRPVRESADDSNSWGYVDENSRNALRTQQPKSPDEHYRPVRENADDPNSWGYVDENSRNALQPKPHPESEDGQPRSGNQVGGYDHELEAHGNVGHEVSNAAPQQASAHPVMTDVPAPDGGPSKQQTFNSEKGFKMKTLDSDFKGEKDGNGKFWNNPRIKVKYLTPEERASREVVVKDGLLVHKQDGRPFDTGDKPEGAIFVMDGEGRIYASTENKPGKFHHSSFLGGEPTAMAGHMLVRDGKIVNLNNQSGHYKPDLDQLQSMRKHLTDQGVNLNDVPNIGLIGKTENRQFTGKWVHGETGADIPGNPQSMRQAASMQATVDRMHRELAVEGHSNQGQGDAAQSNPSAEAREGYDKYGYRVPIDESAQPQQLQDHDQPAANDVQWGTDRYGYRVPLNGSTQPHQAQDHDRNAANDGEWGYDQHGYLVPRADSTSRRESVGPQSDSWGYVDETSRHALRTQSMSGERRNSSRNQRHKSKKVAHGMSE